MLTSILTGTIFLLLLLSCAASSTRRILHQPFFPQDLVPPSQPPAPSPPPPPVPKFPFSTSTPSNTPSFPTYPSPPPPPAFDSFPANISSLNVPSKSKSASVKLIGVAVAVVLAAVIIVSLAVFLHRRRSLFPDHSKTQRSNSTSTTATSFHAAPTNSHLPKLQRPSQTSAEFLYLGTLVNSHPGAAGGSIAYNGSSSTANNKNNTNSNSRKMDSPELRPLPPLNTQQSFRRSRDDEDEEFYSPRVSLNDTGSASRRAFASIQVDRLNKYSSDSSSSCSSLASGSRSGSPARSISLSLSPANSINSIPKSPDLIEIQAFARPLRSALPRDSMIKVSESPSSSSPDMRSEESSPQISDQKMESPERHSPSPLPPPPPPPPLPRKVWESPRTPAHPIRKPQVLVRPMAVESSKNGDKESPPDERNEETSHKPKLKPLHWDKVRASSDREMVWDQLKCSSFKLNEEMIESLFVVNESRWQVLPPSPGLDNNGDRGVLDPKKAQNIAIQLRALNVTVEEVCEGLLEGNTDTLGTELLESLLKMAPTKEEERKIKEYKDASPSNLGSAQRFLKAILDVPNAFKRVDAMLYASNFESDVDYLTKSFATLEAACEELRTSRMFLKLLEAVLKTGNRMNVGTNRGDAHAFKLDTLLKLVDVKGADGKTTLLHFVVQEIIRSEGARLSGEGPNAGASAINDDAKCRKLGLQVVSSLSSELSNVKKAATMDAEVLSSDVNKLSRGIGNIAEVVKLNNGNSNHKFSDSMSSFMRNAEEKIIRIQARESVAVSLVKEITEYFHGNSAREEAHPFRIFMVVRDFLSILDRVCKEVGTINDQTMITSAYKFPIPVNPMLQQQL